MPNYPSDGNNSGIIDLYLEASDRKFYFAIARDNEIDTVKINDILFDPEDQDDDGLYRRYKKRISGIIELDQKGNPIYGDHEFYAGSGLKIEVTFKNEASSLMKELICNYLSGCLEADSINKSNNYIQTIYPFHMPEKNVLLFLKTETTYMLNIFVHEESTQIIEVIHGNDNIKGDLRIPIIVKHFRDDLIEINVFFSNAFSEIDREYLASQLSDVSSIRYNDGERVYESFVGYKPDIPQSLKFFMPPRDVTLYLREKDYRFKLKLLREKDTNHFEFVDICEDHIDARIRQETDSVVYNSIIWYEAFYNPGDQIEIIVHFIPENNQFFYEIDALYMKAQMADINIGPRNFINDNDKYLGYIDRDQKISFIMPNNDVELVIKEKGLISNLTIKPEQYQFNNQDFVGRRLQGVICKGEEYKFGTDHNGITIPVVHHELVDIFVEFTDIYQHLDSDFIVSQDATLFIAEAGEYDLTNNLPSIIPDKIEENRKEFYQYIRFTMPQNDFALVLKWMERLFEIDLNVNYKFVNFIDIYDSYVSYDTSLNGTPTQILQPKFPHQTYPKVLAGPNIETNNLIISVALLEKMEIRTDDSWYVLGYSTIGIGIATSDSMISVNDNNLNFEMPKDNLYIFLRVGFKTGVVILEVEAITGSIVLEPGIYNFKFSGARGGVGGYVGSSGEGNGGHGDGDFGASMSIDSVEITSVITVQYYLGQRGSKGDDGGWEEPGGGGGGGGTSIIIFSSPVFIDGKDTRAILCSGGRGGHGENEDDLISDDDGGDGGSGGTWESGSGSNGGKRGNSGSGGPGGLGYRGTTIDPDLETGPSL
jgi:hypothetical protein